MFLISIHWPIFNMHLTLGGKDVHLVLLEYFVSPKGNY